MENKMKILAVTLKSICLAVCLGLVIIGQRNVGYPGLYTMMAGLCGILLLLHLYNKKYK